MNLLTKLFFLNLLSFAALIKSVKAVEIDLQKYCLVTVQDHKQEYSIFVPRRNLQSIIDQLNVVETDCKIEENS